MKKSYKKFFLATIISALFIFSVVAANAYEISSGGQTNSQPQNSLGNGYNFGDSFKNLVSPFRNFFNGMNQSNNALNLPKLPQNDYKTGGGGTDFGLSNILKQFDDWFYGLTGIRLSGFVFVILKGFSWILGLVKQFIDWLLGFFHQSLSQKYSSLRAEVFLR